jgi:hypothetical protein
MILQHYYFILLSELAHELSVHQCKVNIVQSLGSSTTGFLVQRGRGLTHTQTNVGEAPEIRCRAASLWLYLAAGLVVISIALKPDLRDRNMHQALRAPS